jgi:hypothetical protein
VPFIDSRLTDAFITCGVQLIRFIHPAVLHAAALMYMCLIGVWEYRSHGLALTHPKLLIPLRAGDILNAGSEPKLFHPRQNLGKGKKHLTRASP